jgi:trk system potassium uptake protein TrkH
MDSFLPVLAVLSRVLMMFAPAFLVPLAWAWALDDRGLRACGWWRSLRLRARAGCCGGPRGRFRRELQPRDGILLVNLVWSR